jgi:hypothetical protein
LVDINNDSLLDIYFTTYGDGNYIILNDGKYFKEIKLEKLDTGGLITMSTSF